MWKSSTMTALLIGFALAPVGRCHEPIPEQVRSVVERRVAEVARARELQCLHAKSEADWRTLTQAVRRGSPYERFVAARALAQTQRGCHYLENLAKELPTSEEDFSSVFRALVVAGHAAGHGPAVAGTSEDPSGSRVDDLARQPGFARRSEYAASMNERGGGRRAT